MSWSLSVTPESPSKIIETVDRALQHSPGQFPEDRPETARMKDQAIALAQAAERFVREGVLVVPEGCSLGITMSGHVESEGTMPDSMGMFLNVRRPMDAEGEVAA